MSDQTLVHMSTRKVLRVGLAVPLGAALVVAISFGSVPAGAQQAVPPKKSAVPGKGGAAGGGAAGGQAAPPPAASGIIASDDDPRVKAAVARAAAWLRTRANQRHQPGELALAVHSLAKIHEKYPDLVAENDPALLHMVESLKAYCPPSGFIPAQKGGHDNYEAGVVAMALSAAGGEANRKEIEVVAQYIMSKQSPNGSWNYDGETAGDTSMTQYAILGLWEAASGAGVPVPHEVWDRAAVWLLNTQLSNGGFEYHPPANPPQNHVGDATHTMTVASLGSLYICRDHLPFGKRKNNKGVLLAVEDESAKEKGTSYKPQSTPEAFKQALDRAAAWVDANFTLDKARGAGDGGGGQWYFYYLYAFERFATLAGVTHVAGHHWYDEGARLILAKQQEDGSWTHSHGPEVNTGFAVLFLIRSTYISQKIHQKRIGRGTQISGRGIPKNLDELQQEGGGLKAKGIVGKTGDLLVAIETGNVDISERAARGLLDQMYDSKNKWSAAGEQGAQLKRALEKSIKSKNSEGIKAILKALALTNDFRVVPLLIDGMYYEDDPEVQLEARRALCLISRKFNGFGKIYPEEATKEEWQDEIDRWVAWYKAVRPESAYEDDVDLLTSVEKK